MEAINPRPYRLWRFGFASFFAAGHENVLELRLGCPPSHGEDVAYEARLFRKEKEVWAEV